MENKPLLALQKRPEHYKIVIPIEVERKIRFLCNNIWDVEWSGILFYTYSGSFENNDLVITCKDILPMDIGSSGYTEFFVSPDAATYYVDHPELIECKTGLVHSHGQLSTFFSGTDQSTLQEEGTEKDNFVSLIVNNAGNYTAAITRKVTCKSTRYITFKDLLGKLITFKEEVDDTEEIEWFNLDIEKATENTGDMKELYDRIQSIRESKKAVSITPTSKYNPYIPTTYSSFKDKDEDKDKDQPKLFDWKDYDFNTNSFKKSEPDTVEKIDYTDKVNRIVRQLITGCVLVSDKIKYTNEQFVEGMETLYNKRFNGDMQLFEEWATIFIEFLCFDRTGDDPTELIHEVCKKLSSYKSNKYLQGYIDCLQSYITY